MCFSIAMQRRNVATVCKRNWKYLILICLGCTIISGLHIYVSPKLFGDHDKREYSSIDVIHTSREIGNPATSEVSKSLFSQHATTNTQKGLIEKDTNNVHVLLVTYARSGSSFMGNLLSLGENVFYLFEPSHEIAFGKKNSDEEFPVVLSQILTCDRETLKKIAGSGAFKFFWNKAEGRKQEKALEDMIQECLHSPIKVMKMIRHGLSTAIRLLDLVDPTVTIKVVHLIRDPRAMLKSMRQTDGFQGSNVRAASHCSAIRKDLKDSEQFPQENYLRIRYEDLVSNFLENGVKLYDFIGRPLTDELLLFLASHKWADKFFEKPDLTEYSTFRASNFDPHSWKQKLPPEIIREIGEQCEDIIDLLKYDKWSGNSTSFYNVTTNTILPKNSAKATNQR